MDYLTLFISLKCTNSCTHCLYGCSPQSGEHMSWKVFIRSIEIAEANKIPILNFFGGEPLLNPQFFTMLQTALEKSFFILLATNCRPLSKKENFNKFLDITQAHKEHIIVITTRDRFHLQYFDPLRIIKRLQSQNFNVKVNDYSNHSILISEYNIRYQELLKLDTHFSCCNGIWTDHLGILPKGGWTICPASLEVFGNIFVNSLKEIVDLKHRLSLNYKKGCSECLKDFKGFSEEFAQKGSLERKDTWGMKNFRNKRE